MSIERPEAERIYRLIRDLADPEPCSFDHHGGCQAHGYLDLKPGELCPQYDAKVWLAVNRSLDFGATP